MNTFEPMIEFKLHDHELQTDRQAYKDLNLDEVFEIKYDTYDTHLKIKNLTALE